MTDSSKYREETLTQQDRAEGTEPREFLSFKHTHTHDPWCARGDTINHMTWSLALRTQGWGLSYVTADLGFTADDDAYI